MTKFKAVIIDDEPWTREVVKSLGHWDELSVEVIGEASDGEFGLELIRRMQPDIILTDVRMPHLNGIDLVALLRREGSDAQVLMISGYDDYEYIRSAFLLGVSDYLLKPIKEEELNTQLARCAEQLRQKSVRDEKSQEEGLRAGLGQLAWAKEFFALQNQLRQALHARSVSQIEKDFSALEELVGRHGGQELPKGVVIGIYYTLENVLQRFVLDSGYSMKQACEGWTEEFVFSRETTVQSVLRYLAALCSAAVEGVEKLQRSRSRLDVEQIRRYVEEHFAEEITLAHTAERFYVSMEYLSKTFKSAVGEGFAEYVTRLRMERAAELLADPSVPLKMIGDSVGYADQAHFYKTFKKHFGKTPGQYRQDLKNDNK